MLYAGTLALTSHVGITVLDNLQDGYNVAIPFIPRSRKLGWPFDYTINGIITMSLSAYFPWAIDNYYYTIITCYVNQCHVLINVTYSTLDVIDVIVYKPSPYGLVFTVYT